MAMSGRAEVICNGNGTYGKYYTLRLDWNASARSEEDIRNNRTYITITPSIYYNSSYTPAYNLNLQNTLSFVVGGGWTGGTLVKFDARGTDAANPYYFRDAAGNAVTYGQYVGHNSDGSLTIQVGFSITINHSSITGGTITTNAVLDTIPRASEPSISKQIFNIGDTVTIYTNRKSASFTHTVQMLYRAGVGRTLATGVGDSFQWNTANDGDILYGQIPSDKQEWGTIRLTTYSGGAQIGQKDTTFTAVVTNSDPDFADFSFDTDAKTKALTGKTDGSVLIGGQSPVKFSWQAAAAKNYASIVRYELKAGTKTLSVPVTAGMTAYTATIERADGVELSVTAVDSRGNSALHTKTTAITPYTPVTITSAEARRQNDVDETVALTYKGTIWSGNFGGEGGLENQLTAVYYTYTGESALASKSDITPTVGEDGTFEFSLTGLKGDTAAGFDSAKDYQITLTFKDNLTADPIADGPVTKMVGLTSGIPGLYLEKNNDGSYAFSVGKKPASGTKGIDIDLIWPKGSIFMSMSPDNPNKWFGGTWERMAEGQVLVGVKGSDGDFGPTSTGGVKQVILSEAQMPSHSHPSTAAGVAAGGFNYAGVVVGIDGGEANANPITRAVGGNQPHNNMPPYMTCYIWKRTA